MKRTVVIVIVTLIVAIVAMFISRTALSSAPALMPKVVYVNDMSYISGGIGELESNLMQSLAKDYLLEMVFVQKPVDIQNVLIKGPEVKEEYLVNIQLQVKDHHLNDVLSFTTQGPYVLANFPPGRYLIAAEHKGISKRQWVDIVEKKHQKIVFWWPVPETP